ncbi:MAG: RNase adapter RapZ [bacterium]|nr:RNase adapter RapZ [bacterium]
MKFLILTGMSGAGKTVAIRYLEDLGALCVDNLPPMMLVPFMEACQNSNLKNPVIAIAADIRSGEFFDAKAVTRMIDEARMVGFTIDTLFIEASDEVLVNRYKETRREHPLSSEGLNLEEAIREERERLMPLRETATHLIDTTGLKPRALQKQLRAIVLSADEQPALKVEVMSFGFKRGIPREGDLVFDVRFLPNPFYIPELGHHTGLDEDVRDFVLNHPVTETFLLKVMDMISFLLPNYIAEGKHRLVIAIGCTGGAHRSVAIAEYISKTLGEMGYRTSVNHRDIALEQAHWETRSEYQKGEP